MQRFKQPNMGLHPDGEWVRYSDHVEAMKRIAGAPVAQGLDDVLPALIAARSFIKNGTELGYIRMPDADCPDPAHNTLPAIEAAIAILAQAAPSASAQPAVAWEYSFIHSSATGRADETVGPCLTYDRAQAYGVGCSNQRQVAVIAAPAPASPSDLFAGNAAFNLGYAKGHEDARTAPSASEQQAEPVYQCMCTDDDDADHNQGGKYLWMDVSKEAFEKLSAREDVRSRIVYAAPAPSASPDGARFRWLTDDLAGDEREARNRLLERMAVMSYSASCDAIDEAMRAEEESK